MLFLVARNQLTKKAQNKQQHVLFCVLVCFAFCTVAAEVDFPCFQKIYNGGCTEESQNDVVGETQWLGATSGMPVVCTDF